MGRVRFSDDPPAPDRALARIGHVTANARAELVTATGQALAYAPLPGNTAKELAGPLALMAMRLAEKAMRALEHDMGDRDPRVAQTAARWLVQACPKVAALSPSDAAPAQNADERDAALRQAFESPEFCTLLVRVVSSPDGEARAALIAAGWTAPD